MRLVNKTTILNEIVRCIACEAGIIDADITVYVIRSDTMPNDSQGYMIRLSDTSYSVRLRYPYDIATLAHELKHVYFTHVKQNKFNTGGEELACRLFERRYK